MTYTQQNFPPWIPRSDSNNGNVERKAKTCPRLFYLVTIPSHNSQQVWAKTQPLHRGWNNEISKSKMDSKELLNRSVAMGPPVLMNCFVPVIISMILSPDEGWMFLASKMCWMLYVIELLTNKGIFVSIFFWFWQSFLYLISWRHSVFQVLSIILLTCFAQLAQSYTM